MAKFPTPSSFRQPPPFFQGAPMTSMQQREPSNLLIDLFKSWQEGQQAQSQGLQQAFNDPNNPNVNQVLLPMIMSTTGAVSKIGRLESGIKGSLPKENPLITKAKKVIGTTNRADEAGYITPDGKMLDFTGRHYASGYKGGKPKLGQPDYLAGQRNVDHREIGQIFDEAGAETTGNAMLSFEKLGNIRVSPSGSNLNFSVNLDQNITPQQIQSLKNMQKQLGGKIYYDIYEAGGRNSPIISSETNSIDSIFKQFNKLKPQFSLPQLPVNDVNQQKIKYGTLNPETYDINRGTYSTINKSKKLGEPEQQPSLIKPLNFGLFPAFGLLQSLLKLLNDPTTASLMTQEDQQKLTSVAQAAMQNPSILDIKQGNNIVFSKLRKIISEQGVPGVTNMALTDQGRRDLTEAIKTDLQDLGDTFFAKIYPITQAFGNVNPAIERFSRGGVNWGLDIGVGEGTPVNLPRGQYIVQEAFTGAGPGRLGDSTNKGYGNSVLVQNLNTGEKIRMSHLSQVNVKKGDVISGGVIGAVGRSGNVTGPHLDIEYYDSSGRLKDIQSSQYGQSLFPKNELNQPVAQSVDQFEMPNIFKPRQVQAQESQTFSTPSAQRQITSSIIKPRPPPSVSGPSGPSGSSGGPSGPSISRPSTSSTRSVSQIRIPTPSVVQSTSRSTVIRPAPVSYRPSPIQPRAPSRSTSKPSFNFGPSRTSSSAQLRRR